METFGWRLRVETPCGDLGAPPNGAARARSQGQVRVPGQTRAATTGWEPGPLTPRLPVGGPRREFRLYRSSLPPEIGSFGTGRTRERDRPNPTPGAETGHDGRRTGLRWERSYPQIHGATGFRPPKSDPPRTANRAPFRDPRVACVEGDHTAHPGRAKVAARGFPARGAGAARQKSPRRFRWAVGRDSETPREDNGPTGPTRTKTPRLRSREAGVQGRDEVSATHYGQEPMQPRATSAGSRLSPQAGNGALGAAPPRKR